MPAQNHIAPVNTRIVIPSSQIGRTYEITKHANGSWSCSCPAWRNQHMDPMLRRCKHMEQVGIDLSSHVVGAHAAAHAAVAAAG
jgi:hypothetical protein